MGAENFGLIKSMTPLSKSTSSPRDELFLVRTAHYRESTSVSSQDKTVGIAARTARQEQNGTAHLLIFAEASRGDEPLVLKGFLGRVTAVDQHGCQVGRVHCLIDI